MPHAHRYSPSIEDYAKDLLATQQLWIFDCCHAGNALFFEQRGQAVAAAAATAFALHHAGKIAVRGLAAVSGAELSLEKDGSGVYTKALTAAIKELVKGPNKSCVSADLFPLVARKTFVESGSKMTVQAGPMLCVLGGMLCDGDVVLFDANDPPPPITAANAPIEVVGDARGNAAAAAERARIREAKGRVAALESARDCAGLVAVARNAEDAEVTASAIKALEYFAKTHAGKGEMVRAGGISAVVAALKSHVAAANVAEAAMDVLAWMTNADGQENKTTIAAAGGILGAIAAMYAHRDVPGVQQWGCTMLGNLAANHPANQTAIVAAGGIECAVAGMRAHRGAAEVQQWGCHALGNLAACHPANQTVIAAAGGIEDVVVALRAHSGAEQVQQKGSYVFYHLVDHQQAAVVASGAPALVASAARRFRSNTTIQAYAKEVATVLVS